jgi:hypothetical protein
VAVVRVRAAVVARAVAVARVRVRTGARAVAVVPQLCPTFARVDFGVVFGVILR